jgi:HSP20 family protein
MTIYISPYRRMLNLRSAMDRLFEENFSETDGSEREMLLAVDVEADDDTYTIQAFVPGLDAEDLNIEVLNNTVAIRGEFKGVGDESPKYLINELPVGRFARIITLPTALEPGKAEATIKNGLLVLRVPKAEAHRPKAIKVTAS